MNTAARNANIGKHYNRTPLIPDKVNSTYWWQMQMNPDQRVKLLTGYSKMEGYRESLTADQTLAIKLTMFYKQGYLHRTSCITVYKRIGAMCSMELDEPILVITPREIVYLGESLEFQKFLTNFRQCIDKGIAPKVHLYPLNS